MPLILALGVVNVAVFLVLAQASGHITANEGRGYDGVSYIQMISSNVLDGGSQNTRLRPVIVLLNWRPTGCWATPSRRSS